MSRRNWRRTLGGLKASAGKLLTAVESRSSDGPNLELFSDTELERYQYLLTRLATNTLLARAEEEELEALYHRPPMHSGGPLTESRQ